jgi:hypothetical protein
LRAQTPRLLGAPLNVGVRRPPIRAPFFKTPLGSLVAIAVGFTASLGLALAARYIVARLEMVPSQTMNAMAIGAISIPFFVAIAGADGVLRARLRDPLSGRKSQWNALLIPAVFLPLGAMGFSAIHLGDLLHEHLYEGENLRCGRGIGPIILEIAPFLGAFPLALLGGNALVRLIPAASRAIDAEAQRDPERSFQVAQRTIRRAALFLVPVSVGTSLAAVLMSWS